MARSALWQQHARACSSGSSSVGGAEMSGVRHEQLLQPWSEYMELLHESELETGGKIINSPLPSPSEPMSEREVARRTALEAELAAVGLRLRSNSMLCRDYVRGRLGERVDAQTVAQVMAGMRYLNEYSHAFEEALDKWAGKVHATVAVLRRRNGSHFYAGIHADACEVVYGHGARHYNDIRRHMYTDWTDFPQRWPWLDEANFGYNDNGKSIHKSLTVKAKYGPKASRAAAAKASGADADEREL